MSLNSRNDTLNQKIDATDLPSAVHILIADAHKRKRQLILLTLSVIIEALLTAGLVGGFLWNHSLALKAENNHQAIVRNCETSNDARSKNKELWDFAFNLPTTEAPTPQQQANLEKFKAKVNDTFQLRNCSAIK